MYIQEIATHHPDFYTQDYPFDGFAHDYIRNKAYRQALERSVSGKVVLDIGTGRDALLAKMAVECGASKVYAVERQQWGYDRALVSIGDLPIELILGDAEYLELPEPVDAIVSELFGGIASWEGCIPALNHCLGFLKPGGVVIPEVAKTKVARYSLASDKIVGVNGIFEDLPEVEDFEVLDMRSLPLAPSTGNLTLSGKSEGLLFWLELDFGQGLKLDTRLESTNWLNIYLPGSWESRADIYATFTQLVTASG